MIASKSHLALNLPWDDPCGQNYGGGGMGGRCGFEPNKIEEEKISTNMVYTSAIPEASKKATRNTRNHHSFAQNPQLGNKTPSASGSDCALEGNITIKCS